MAKQKESKYHWKAMRWREGKLVSMQDHSSWDIGVWRSLPKGQKAIACNQGFHTYRNIEEIRDTTANPEVIALVEVEGASSTRGIKHCHPKMRVLGAWVTRNHAISGGDNCVSQLNNLLNGNKNSTPKDYNHLANADMTAPLHDAMYWTLTAAERKNKDLDKMRKILEEFVVTKGLPIHTNNEFMKNQNIKAEEVERGAATVEAHPEAMKAIKAAGIKPVQCPHCLKNLYLKK